MAEANITVNISKDGIRTHCIQLDVPDTYTASRAELIALFRRMLLLRLMEQKIGALYAEGRVRGFCHLCVGQEGLYAALGSIIADDKLIGSYRCHGAAYATGSSIKEIICENLGLRDGCSRGRGGSMHLYNDRFFGGHGIVGAQVPVGLGIAFAIKYRRICEHGADEWKSAGSPGVCFALYGDGASNQGQVYESFNMARLYGLPIVYVCENNRYSMYTPVERTSVDDNFYKRGYGIPGLRTSDSDLLALVCVLRQARAHAMKNGPIIVQVDTDRKCGHSTLDTTQFYRCGENSGHRDCLDSFEAFLREAVGAEELGAAKDRIAEEFQAEISGIDYENTPASDELYRDL